MVFDPVTQDGPINSAEYPSSMIPISFYSGDYKIIGSFFIANGKGPHPTVILLHGFPGNENNFDFAHAIKRAGWNVLVFHYRGTWGSDGYFSWSNSIDDVKASINFINSSANNSDLRIYKNKIVLIGHSMGGFAALLSSIEFDNIRNVASLTGFNFGNFAELMKNDKEIMDAAIEQLEESVNFIKGTATDKLVNEMITLKDYFNLINHAEKFSHKNLLVIGAKFDSIAPTEIHFSPLVKSIRANKPINFVDLLLDTGHSFSDSRIKLTRLLINWLNKISF